MLAIIIISFVVTLVLGFPIAFCLGITSTVALLASDFPLSLIAQRMFTGIDSFPLMAVPFFVLAGDLMNSGGTTERLIAFANVLVGRIRGGLAHTNIVTSMFFGGISGSAVADTSALGTILVPGMVQKGYDQPFSAAVTAASSTMGPIIPPSILMVIMGVTTGVSIGGLFAAGLVPGLLLGVSMMVLSYVLAIKRDYPKDEVPFSLTRFWKAFIKAFPALMAPAIILGGILGGIFTATEAAVVAVFYALFLGLLVYKELKVSDLVPILISSGTTTAVLLLVIAMANIFSWILTAQQIPQQIAQGILSITQNKFLVLLMVNLFLLFIGTFLEGGAAIIILAPTLMKIAQVIGVDPLHFGFVMVFNLVVGLLTPPLGVCLFVVCGVTDTPLPALIKAVVPFLILEIGILLLLTYFPSVIMVVPRLLGYA